MGKSNIKEKNVSLMVGTITGHSGLKYPHFVAVASNKAKQAHIYFPCTLHMSINVDFGLETLFLV